MTLGSLGSIGFNDAEAAPTTTDCLFLTRVSLLAAPARGDSVLFTSFLVFFPIEGP